MGNRVMLEAEPTPLELDLSQTCVIITDMQNAFLAKGGLMDLMGFDLTPVRSLIEPIKKLNKAARTKGCKVIFVATEHHPGDAGTGPDSVYWYKEGSLALYREKPELKDKLLLPGTWGAEISPELELQESDIIVLKPRYSSFFDTNLDTVLKRYNLKYLLTVGAATNCCIESTIRDAYYRGYFGILISDVTAAVGPPFMQEASLFNIKTFFGWVTNSDSVLKAMT